MTQARTVGVGAEYIADATQLPTARTFATVPSLRNRCVEQVKTYRVRSDADATADFVWNFIAEDNGRIEAIRLQNGTTAIDGTNGWELEFLNTDNSDERIAYFGFGTGTEAAKATDKASTVAASTLSEKSNSILKNFNKGDVVQVTADRDGTAVTSTIDIVVSYGSEGTADD